MSSSLITANATQVFSAADIALAYCDDDGTSKELDLLRRFAAAAKRDGDVLLDKRDFLLISEYLYS